MNFSTTFDFIEMHLYILKKLQKNIFYVNIFLKSILALFAHFVYVNLFKMYFLPYIIAKYS